MVVAGPHASVQCAGSDQVDLRSRLLAAGQGCLGGPVRPASAGSSGRPMTYKRGAVESSTPSHVDQGESWGICCAKWWENGDVWP